MRTVEVAAVGELTSWDSFVAAARGYGVSDPGLWVALVREIAPHEQPLEECLALVSTRRFADGYAALQAYRPRWHIENDGYRELKEGFGLEEQRWGRDAAAAHGRTTLTILAFNTSQVYRMRGGQQLAKLGIRRLRRRSQPELGPSPVVIFLDDCYAVLALEELLAAVGLGRGRDCYHGSTPSDLSDPSDLLSPIVWLQVKLLASRHSRDYPRGFSDSRSLAHSSSGWFHASAHHSSIGDPGPLGSLWRDARGRRVRAASPRNEAVHLDRRYRERVGLGSRPVPVAANRRVYGQAGHALEEGFLLLRERISPRSNPTANGWGISWVYVTRGCL